MVVKGTLQSVTGIAEQTADQITERTQAAIENYFSLLQRSMSASPWGNTDLNKKLLSYANANVSVAFEFVQKLRKAKNLEDVVKIQTEFIGKQLTSFNEQAKNIGEIYTKASQ